MNLHVEEWTEKKRQIVDTTITKIATQGFENVTIAKIAKDAGVGEGTIYRHFQSKDELIDIAAEYAAQAITQNIRKNHTSELPVKKQFISFCCDFIESGRTHEGPHRYLNRYMNSPQGLAYRKEMFEKVGKDPSSVRPLFYPLNKILVQAREEQKLKDMPLQLHALMTLSTLVFVVNDAALGLVPLNKGLITAISTACWDAVKK